MIKRCDKRAQGLSVNAIILIVLGVIILVMLIVGFTLGWKTFLPFLASDNVQKVADSCTTACSLNAVYDYCGKERKLIDELGEEVTTSCYEFANLPHFTSYGIAKCPSVACKDTLKCADIKFTSKIKGSISVQAVAGTTACNPLTQYDVSSIVTFATPPSNTICCIAK